MSPHTSDEVLDNYVNTLDGSQAERLQKTNRLITERRNRIHLYSCWIHKTSLSNILFLKGMPEQEKSNEDDRQSRSFCFPSSRRPSPPPSPIFLALTQSATDILVINADLYRNKLEVYVYSCTLYFGIKFLNVVPTVVSKAFVYIQSVSDPIVYF